MNDVFYQEKETQISEWITRDCGQKEELNESQYEFVRDKSCQAHAMYSQSKVTSPVGREEFAKAF